ncbi:hypothetical protein AMTR_s00030p00242290 [Amborella trichopoda]|uniref:Uncharacterized protein n=1 Tax=Amborella trichopoda TaxID=13333 RepID=U5D195_AMBTC|nr:hypothetical protein AMTR_s00030p00242290 [Amborella trichopoda]
MVMIVPDEDEPVSVEALDQALKLQFLKLKTYILWGSPLPDEDVIPSGFESEKAKVVLEEAEVASMVRDMGMYFNIPIGLFFEEVKRLKAARVSQAVSSVMQAKGKAIKEPHSAAGNKMKKHVKKIFEFGYRSSARLETRGIIKKTSKTPQGTGKATLFVNLLDLSDDSPDSSDSPGSVASA